MEIPSIDKKFRKKEDLVFRDEEECGLLFDIETGKIHKLNQTAALIWKSINPDVTVECIINVLKKEYGDTDSISTDVPAFLLILQEMDYIEEI